MSSSEVLVLNFGGVSVVVELMFVPGGTSSSIASSVSSLRSMFEQSSNLELVEGSGPIITEATAG